MPDLPAEPDWQDVLHRAFLANGDLEAAYFEWQASLKRVQITGAYPDSNAALGYEYMFSKEKMKSWDRNTLSLGFDPSMNLSLPFKVMQASKVSLEEAKAKGERFEAAKFSLQQKVLTAWFELTLLQEKIRIQKENVSLLKLIADTASQRVRAGSPQQDLLKAQTEYEMALNDVANMQSEQASTRAMLNAMLARDPDSPLEPPHALPEPRPLPVSDQALVAKALENNPELAAIAHEVEGRNQGVRLAELGYLPDVSASISIRGSIQQNIGTMITWPLNLGKVAASVEEARAMLRQSEASARQTRSDRLSQFASALYAVRNDERQVEVFTNRILPNAQKAWENSIHAYSTGNIGFSDLIDAQRLLLQVRLMIVEARMGREKRLAELEALAGMDVETITRPAGPATATADLHLVGGSQPAIKD